MIRGQGQRTRRQEDLLDEQAPKFGHRRDRAIPCWMAADTGTHRAWALLSSPSSSTTAEGTRAVRFYWEVWAADGSRNLEPSSSDSAQRQ
jgi:hypothetical protein